MLLIFECVCCWFCLWCVVLLLLLVVYVFYLVVGNVFFNMFLFDVVINCKLEKFVM